MVYWLITFVALYAGNEIIAKVVDSIPAWVINGLNAVAKVLPAMGFALLLNSIDGQRYSPLFNYGLCFIFMDGSFDDSCSNYCFGSCFSYVTD